MDNLLATRAAILDPLSPEYMVWDCDDAHLLRLHSAGYWGTWDIGVVQVASFTHAQWLAMPDAPQLDKGGGPVEVELIVRAKGGESLRDTITRACNDATKGDNNE